MEEENNTKTLLGSKQQKRILAKKRKAEAFLQLVKSKDEIECKDQSQTSTEKSTSDNKKVKYEQEEKDGAKTAAQIAEEELEKIRKAIRERQKASMEKPKVYMVLDELASNHGRLLCKEYPEPKLPPLFMSDVQHLLLNAIQGQIASYKPRWCKLLRCSKIAGVNVIVLDGVSDNEFQQYPECFPKLQEAFKMSTEMVSPSEYGSTVAEEIFNVPVSNNRLESKAKYFRVNNKDKGKFEDTAQSSLKKDIKEETNKSVIEDMEGVKQEKDESLSDENNTSPQHIQSDAFPRTKLLMDTLQLVWEGYPVPNSRLDEFNHFKFTSKKYGEVSDQSPLFAVDCEMCITTAKKSELTRVSVINEDLEVMYDTYVKPHNRVINYLTRYSGITKKILDPVTTRLEDVQKTVCEILPDNAILCGQSLGMDLRALQMFHPYVIDTSCIYNLSGQRHFKTGLKALAAHFLGEKIQDDVAGHCSVEDAKATMRLVKLKLGKSLDFGDMVMGQGFHNDSIVEQSNENSVSSENTSTVKSNDKEMIENVTNKTEKDSSETAVTSHSKTSVKRISAGKFVFHSLHGSTESNTKQMKTFYQGLGSCLYFNFFELTRNVDKTAVLVEEKTVVDLYKNMDIVTMETDCDRTSKSLCKSFVQFHDLVYANFPSFKEAIKEPDLTEENRKRFLKKMDNRVWKVVKHTRSNNLTVVIMSGRIQDSNIYSARTFLRIN